MFKSILIRKGFSQRGLGRAINISSPYATQIVNGTKNPGPEIAKKIVDVLEIQFDEVFFIEGADKSNQDTA